MLHRIHIARVSYNTRNVHYLICGFDNFIVEYRIFLQVGIEQERIGSEVRHKGDQSTH